MLHPWPDLEWANALSAYDDVTSTSWYLKILNAQAGAEAPLVQLINLQTTAGAATEWAIQGPAATPQSLQVSC